MFKTLEDLVKIIRDRKKSSSEKSYTHKLLNNKKLEDDQRLENSKINDTSNLILFIKEK